MRRRGRRILKEDVSRIQEAILHLVTQKPRLTQYGIVKALFLADRSHLNRYGRPITFDNYIALEHGPVPSLAYDALKPSFDYEACFGEPRPWVSTPDPLQSKNNRFAALRAPRRDVLSATDIEALDDALHVVSSLSFGQLKRLTHEDPAYVEAWDHRGDLQMADMHLPLLIEENGEERVAELAYISAQT